MTNSEFAILALIAEQARHGYEIEQVIEARGMRDWTEVGFSSIYYILKKLEETGYITSKLAQGRGRGPARKVYSLTPEGLAAWQAATRLALSAPQPVNSTIQLGLASLPALSPGEAAQALQHYQTELEARRQAVLERWEAQKPVPFFVDAMFAHSLALLEAEIKWAQPVIDQLSKEHRNG